MKKNLQKLHVQRKIWRGHNKNSLCWAFYCVNDGEKVEVASHQVMRCILCYDTVINIFNPRTKERKRLITYYKTYGIITLKKHVDADHFIIAKKVEKEVNNEIIRNVEKQLAKKRPNVPTSAISAFFCYKKTFQKNDVQKKNFLQDLHLLIVKNNLSLQFVESTYGLKIVHLFFEVVFHFRK
jgi:hypothetical protein